MPEETPTESSTAMTPITGLASSGVAVVGGLAATTSPDNGIATFGVCGVIGGLITAFGTAFYPWFRDWLAHQRVVNDLAKLDAEFKASQKRNHDRVQFYTAKILELDEARIKIARLEGQLGVTAVAVSANAANTQAVASQTGAKLPVPVPAVPSLPSSASLSDSILIPATGASQSHEQAQQE